MKTNQQGATLIVVLMILLLIMVVGTLAIRQSVSSLKMVANNQIQALLLQNSDAALMYFQNPVNTSTLASANGVVNYFRNVGNLNQEMVSCFNKTAPFVMSNMGVVNSSGTVDNQASCKSTDAAGGRTQVVTQVYIKKAASSDNQPFADYARGTDITTAKTESSLRLQLTSVSVMTGFSSAEDINTCLNKSASSAISCLSQKQVLFNSQVAEYRFLSDFEPPK
ncbi:PilX N-terminal domain-containing pilus assembly protein [uncultured Acinetobacter sp.]|uniref:PilX N-terminal domain-containing pilus assembly protein n=1 Tax=uncultured Acinetobacter sp. TaxID=165433 RepID=UPI00258855BB|nr:PilX N-terminal domain-containing pilus assembly protein [uncultured Acinetobacter sp.]